MNWIIWILNQITSKLIRFFARSKARQNKSVILLSIWIWHVYEAAVRVSNNYPFDSVRTNTTLRINILWVQRLVHKVLRSHWIISFTLFLFVYVCVCFFIHPYWMIYLHCVFRQYLPAKLLTFNFHKCIYTFSNRIYVS